MIRVLKRFRVRQKDSGFFDFGMTRDQEAFRNYPSIGQPIRVEKACELKNADKIQMELYGKIEHQKLRFVPNEKQIIKTIDDGVDRELIRKHESEPIKYSWAE